MSSVTCISRYARAFDASIRLTGGLAFVQPSTASFCAWLAAVLHATWVRWSARRERNVHLAAEAS